MDDQIDSWLNNVAYSHSGSQGTAHQYRYYFKKFCAFIGKSPEEILQDYGQISERDFRRLYGQHLQNLISNQKKLGYADKSIGVFVAAVRSFFKYKDLPLGFVPTNKGRVTYHNRDFTKDDLQKIIAIARPRDRAFFVMMAQSGLRPNTLCNLRLRDIEPDFSKGTIPVKISVSEEITKGKNANYITFMGAESVRYLHAYFDAERPNITEDDLLFVRHGSLDNARKTKKPKQVSNDVSLARSFSTVFKNIVRQLHASGKLKFELRQGTKEHKTQSELRMYGLRKFFRKYANQAGFENVEYWMGHTSFKQEQSYRPRDPEYYRELYTKFAMPNLRIESLTPIETENELKAIKEQDKKELDKLKRQIRTLKFTVKEIRKDRDEYKKKNPMQEELEIAKRNAEYAAMMNERKTELLRKFFRGETFTEDEQDELIGYL